jgi:hypothetical protein
MKLPHFLTILLAGTISASAASTVLYQTSWDPTPAPAWAAGAINGQNGWLATSASGFQVVANGSAAALGVVTTSGNQFARLLANPSTTGSSNRYAWTDLTAKFAARPPGANILKASFDVYMPASQEFDGSLYGIRAFHPTSIPYSLLIEADDRSINLLVGGSFVYVSDAFEYDTWFNVAVFANYTTGDLTVAKNGVLLPTVTGNNPAILSGSLEDVDLFSINDPTGPATRVMFVENYSVSVEGSAPPSLSIAPIPPDNIAYRIKWPAANANWILEYTDDLVTGGSVWSDQGTAPEPDADPLFVHVDVALEALHRYFRLRQP